MQAISVAYAIWNGVGAIGVVLVGVIFNNEKVNLEKALFLSLIIFKRGDVKNCLRKLK